MRAAGYDTVLIGKSHLQTVLTGLCKLIHLNIVTGFPLHRTILPWPSGLTWTVMHTNMNARFSMSRMIQKVPLPFYGFDEYISVLRHGFNTGGDHERHVKRVAPDVMKLKSRDVQFSHDYICPQAIRTKMPEEHYSTSYIARKTTEFLKSAPKGNPKPFFLMVSFPDPHHPFTPPGKYWDMYNPDDMPVPQAYQTNDWNPPEYVKIAERDRQKDPSLGQHAGYSVAVSQREAQEARALTCGMITMVDDAVGQIRQAAVDANIAENTVQIFTSDHGDHLGEHRLCLKALNSMTV